MKKLVASWLSPPDVRDQLLVLYSLDESSVVPSRRVRFWPTVKILPWNEPRSLATVIGPVSMPFGSTTSTVSAAPVGHEIVPSVPGFNVLPLLSVISSVPLDRLVAMIRIVSPATPLSGE